METTTKSRRQLIDDADARVHRAFMQLAEKKNRAARLASDIAEASEAVDAANTEVEAAELARDKILTDRTLGTPQEGAGLQRRTPEERKAILLELLGRTVNFASEIQPTNAEVEAVWLWPSKRQALKLKEDGWHIQAFTTKEIQELLTPDDITAMLALPNWQAITHSAA